MSAIRRSACLLPAIIADYKGRTIDAGTTTLEMEVHHEQLPPETLQPLAKDCRWHRHGCGSEIAGPSDDEQQITFIESGMARQYLLVAERRLTQADPS